MLDPFSAPMIQRGIDDRKDRLGNHARPEFTGHADNQLRELSAIENDYRAARIGRQIIRPVVPILEIPFFQSFNLVKELVPTTVFKDQLRPYVLDSLNLDSGRIALFIRFNTQFIANIDFMMSFPCTGVSVVPNAVGTDGYAKITAKPNVYAVMEDWDPETLTWDAMPDGFTNDIFGETDNYKNMDADILASSTFLTAVGGMPLSGVFLLTDIEDTGSESELMSIIAQVDNSSRLTNAFGLCLTLAGDSQYNALDNKNFAMGTTITGTTFDVGYTRV